MIAIVMRERGCMKVSFCWCGDGGGAERQILKGKCRAKLTF